MGLPSRYLPHSVLLSGPTWINQIDQTSIEDGVQLMVERSGSATDPEFVAIQTVRPRMNFSTSDLTVLTTVGFNGLSLTGTGTTLTSWGRQLPLGSLPAAIASTVHLKMVCTDGLLIPARIAASGQNKAMLALQLIGYLGTTGSSGSQPFAWTASSAITSGAGQMANVYVCSAVKYTISGGSSRLVQGLENQTVDFGIEPLVENSDGEVYASHVSIRRRTPTLSFDTKDDELVTEITADGLNCSSFAMYFQQKTANGQNVAKGTASHISITSSSGLLVYDRSSLRVGQSGDGAFRYQPTLNTTTITISTTATIPTS